MIVILPSPKTSTPTVTRRWDWPYRDALCHLTAKTLVPSEEEEIFDVSNPGFKSAAYTATQPRQSSSVSRAQLSVAKNPWHGGFGEKNKAPFGFTQAWPRRLASTGAVPFKVVRLIGVSST